MTEMKEKIYPTLPVIRESPSAPDIELTEMRNEGAHSYRLKVITDVQKYLEGEITRRENFSKKYFRISRVINSVDSVLISISLGAGITGAVLLSTVVAAPVVLGLEISAGAIGLISLIGNVVSKKTAIKAEKHLKIKMLASAKLDTIKTHVSKALIDDHISHDEFNLIMEELNKYKRKKKKRKQHPKNLGDIAYNYLHGKEPYPRDKTFGIYLGKDGHYHIGKQINKENKKILTIAYNNIIVDGQKFRGTPGLWELIMEDKPRNYTKEDIDEYTDLLRKTNALHHDFNPKNPNPRSSVSYKWKNILSPIWHSGEFAGKGIVIMPSDPNALLERLDLLLASQEAGHTGVGNELVSICDELKRQGDLDAETYKKLNSIIKNDST